MFPLPVKLAPKHFENRVWFDQKEKERFVIHVVSWCWRYLATAIITGSRRRRVNPPESLLLFFNFETRGVRRRRREKGRAISKFTPSVRSLKRDSLTTVERGFSIVVSVTNCGSGDRTISAARKLFFSPLKASFPSGSVTPWLALGVDGSRSRSSLLSSPRRHYTAYVPLHQQHFLFRGVVCLSVPVLLRGRDGRVGGECARESSSPRKPQLSGEMKKKIRSRSYSLHRIQKASAHPIKRGNEPFAFLYIPLSRYIQPPSNRLRYTHPLPTCKYGTALKMMVLNPSVDSLGPDFQLKTKASSPREKKNINKTYFKRVGRRGRQQRGKFRSTFWNKSTEIKYRRFSSFWKYPHVHMLFRFIYVDVRLLMGGYGFVRMYTLVCKFDGGISSLPCSSAIYIP